LDKGNPDPLREKLRHQLMNLTFRFKELRSFGATGKTDHPTISSQVRVELPPMTEEPQVRRVDQGKRFPDERGRAIARE
jgi:hypothetical protein